MYKQIGGITFVRMLLLIVKPRVYSHGEYVLVVHLTEIERIKIIF
jgi:hypothetical protein